MSFIEKIPDDKIRAFAITTYNRLQSMKDDKTVLSKQILKFKKRLGIQEDGFIDTPSLNLVFFDGKTGHPYCEEHGAMNRYEHSIYRCVMCGVVVSLENRQFIRKRESKTDE